MRYVLWIGYGVLLFVLLLLSQPRRAPEGTGFVAAVPLEANRPLRPGDVVLAREPAYVRRPLRKGEPVKSDDLLAWPLVKPPAGNVAVALPAGPAVPSDEALQAGEQAALCPAPPGEPKRLKIIAMVCGARGEGCMALLAASPQQAAALAAEQQAGRATTAERVCGEKRLPIRG